MDTGLSSNSEQDDENYCTAKRQLFDLAKRRLQET